MIGSLNLLLSLKIVSVTFASVLLKYEQEDIPSVSKSSTNAIGLDYKSDGLYMDSNGNKAGVHKYYRESHKKLVKEQRRLSRKQVLKRMKQNQATILNK